MLTATNQDALEVLDQQALQLGKNAAHVYLESLKESGKRSQKHALNKIAGMLLGGVEDYRLVPWGKLRAEHTSTIRTRLIEGSAPATVRRSLCALRQTLRQAWRMGQMTQQQYAKAVDLNPVGGETLPAGRALDPGEIGALMAACEQDTSAAGVRDGAIIALMYICGPRLDEIAHVDRESYNQETGKLEILHAKRGKQRTAYPTNGAVDALADWLSIRGDEPGPLFYPINKAGKIATKRMTNQAIYNLLQKRAEQAGIKHFSPHDLRRTFISDLLEAGADIATVAKMAGHSSVNTTARYDRRPEQAKQKAAGLLHVPYHGRK